MQKNKGEKERKLKGADLFMAEIVSLGALECSIPTLGSQGKESGLAPGCQPVLSQKRHFPSL